MGVHTESHYALVIPNADLTGTMPAAPLSPTSADIGSIALVPASYGSYRINKDLVLACRSIRRSVLSTKPDPFFGKEARWSVVQDVHGERYANA